MRKAVKNHHEREDADETDRPRNDNGAGIRTAGGHVARKRKDAAADTGSDDHHGQAEQVKSIGIDDAIVLSLG